MDSRIVHRALLVVSLRKWVQYICTSSARAPPVLLIFLFGQYNYSPLTTTPAARCHPSFTVVCLEFIVSILAIIFLVLKMVAMRAPSPYEWQISQTILSVTIALGSVVGLLGLIFRKHTLAILCDHKPLPSPAPQLPKKK